MAPRPIPTVNVSMSPLWDFRPTILEMADEQSPAHCVYLFRLCFAAIRTKKNLSEYIAVPTPWARWDGSVWYGRGKSCGAQMPGALLTKLN